MNKKEEILEACKKVINGIEDETINGNSALLICKKIARLTNDNDAMIWLDYESKGYDRTPDGKHIESVAFKVAIEHKRGYMKDGNQYIFTELISELDDLIMTCKNSINSFSTSGTSVGGEYAYIAMDKLVNSVSRNVSTLNLNIKEYSKKKSILLNEYYNYAHIKQVELLYGSVTLNIFEMYQERVNTYFNTLNKELILKLDAIQDSMNEVKSESYSHALLTCRKLFEEIAKDLFNKVLPDFKDSKFKSNTGKEIDITGDHTINQLSAVIETIETKNPKNTITGSSIIYIIDWITNLNDSQSKGVHHTIDKELAEKCIIQTYIALANIIDLFLKYKK